MLEMRYFRATLHAELHYMPLTKARITFFTPVYFINSLDWTAGRTYELSRAFS